MLKSKYNSKKITIDGIIFDSTIEGTYYKKLLNDKAKGYIINFERQPQYVLINKFINFGKSIKSIIYKADFLIYELDGSETVIDIKGIATSEAKLKRKMFQFYYPGIKLLWLCWYKNEWQNYDEVQKQKSYIKKLKKVFK